MIDALNAFTGAALDRAPDERKDPEWVAAQREHPRARAILAGDDGVHVDGDRLALVPLPAGGEPILLGLDAEGPLFALDTEPDGSPPRPLVGGGEGGGAAAPPPGGIGPVGLRDAVSSLPHDEGGLVAYAAALINWHRRHGFCASCANATRVEDGGFVRVCPRCGLHHFPRTDPVVIMAVHDGPERLLLGRQARWAPGRYSALAGFVEPGESLEEAVAREVREEAHVEIALPHYESSQPWPFPESLMLGFTAQWRGGEPRRQEGEIEDVRWFSRAEIEDAVAGRGPVNLPHRYAIARQLIEGWLANACPKG